MIMNVTLKANANSSRRTRNRIREHGPNFRAVNSRGLTMFGKELHWLLRAEDGWFGWLPRAEFDFGRPVGHPDFRDMMPTSQEFYDDYVGWKD
jgi:hypothetical protein